MMKRQIIVSAISCALLLPVSFSWAGSHEKEQMHDQVQVYGSQLMTEQERNEYRNLIKAAKTAKEREMIRLEHHKQMTQRAKKQGVTLPDEPPVMGSHRGMGAEEGMRPRDGIGSGGGMRPRDGMGPGGGQGR